MIAGDFAKMSDDDLYNLYVSSRTVDMPNHLADVADETQRFVYKTQLNTKPQVLDSADFDKYLKDNKISSSEIMVRSLDSISYQSGGVHYKFSAGQLHDMTRYGIYNYIGGKNGGQVSGAGTYFERNGGYNTGYGRTSMRGVLSKNAKVISRTDVDSKWRQFVSSRPKMAKTNPSMSVKALMMGYNVVWNGRSYFNVIDRSAVVLDKNNF